MMSRKYILDILDKVFAESGYASLLMRSAPEDTDMAFVSETVYGTIRNYSLLEAQWRPYASSVRRRTALLLDMSVYQLFFMDGVPAYAVVSEAVELAKPQEKKFVNAVLRKVQAAGLSEPEDLCVKYSHPKWIADLWKAHYGEETMLKIMQADQERGRIAGRINTLKSSREEFENDSRFHFISEESFIYDGSLQKTEEFREGKVLIQDLHSQQVVRLLGTEPGMRVLDACAAPGTKTQQIACRMHNEGSITAQELYEARTQLITKLMERCGVSIVTAVTGDASASGRYPEKTFDRILADVPCSGLGDLRHKPEIRWHLKPENIDGIVKLQAAILDANAPYLKEGGILVYSTCTLNRKENEAQIRRFLASRPDYTCMEMKTMFPYEDRADGFFAAKLIRNSI